jgi:hypothetical protein
VHSRRRAHLTVHAGGVAPDPLPTAEQLKLGENNHRVPQARMRTVAEAVRAGTYRGRDGRSHPFQARHRELMWCLCAYANQYGEVHPDVITLGALALELGRGKDNVNTDVRQLEAALLLWRRPVTTAVGSAFVYVIPGMAAPLDDRRTVPRRPGG